MNNLTTRKIVLGLLMTLVLAFSVQGTADALTLTRRTSDDLKTLRRGDQFTINFNVSDLTATSSAADEILTIPAVPDLTLKRIGSTTIPSADAGSDITLHEAYDPSSDGAGHKSYQRLQNRDYSVTYQVDSNASYLAKSDSIESGGESVPFTVYVVPRDDGVGTTEVVITLTSQAGPGFIAKSGAGPIGIAIDSTSNLPVTYRIIEGSGQIYVRHTTNSDRVRPKRSRGQDLLTSSATDTGDIQVYLDMRSSSNKVTVRVGDQHRYAKTFTFIYGRPVLTKTSSGDDQEGAFGGQLANALEVKLTDGKAKAISGVPVPFEPTEDSTIIPVLGTVVYVTAQNGNTLDSTAITGSPAAYTVTVKSNNLTGATAGNPVWVQTNNSGVAKVYLQLLARSGTETTAPETVTVSFPNAYSEMFSATAVHERISSTLETLPIEKVKDKIYDLTVRVQRGGHNYSLQNVQFTTNKGAFTRTNDTPLADNADQRDQTVITQADGTASVRYYVGEDTASRRVSVRFTDPQSGSVLEESFTINPGGTSRGSTTQQQQQQQQPGTPTNTITISPSSTTGAPGSTVTVSVSSSPSDATVTLSSNDFANTNFSPQVDVTPFSSTLTLPSSAGTYTFFAVGTVAGTAASESAVVTVTSPELGTLTISPTGAAVNGVQSVSITARTADNTIPEGALFVTLGGTGFTTTSVPITGGSATTGVALPTTASTYTLTVSATGYNPASTILVVSGGTGQQQQQQQQQVPTVAEPSSIQISGPATRSGTVNTQLDSPLLARVLDADGNGVPNARVIFRVRTGQGRLSARGNGRAVGVQTDSSGFARTNYTPASASSTVEAEVRRVTRTVEFTITTGTAVTTRIPGPSGTPGTISPTVLVGTANRPPMIWVDGGAIYALVGASVERFAPSVDNAQNLAVGSGKVYWTEATGESGGTINSANLNGSGVTELASILATPMGIAVDTAGSKLYWTNSRGKIQNANLDGSGITDVIPGGLEGAMDIALAGGNAYWTQGGNVRFVNLRGQKQIRNVSTGTDTAGSLAIANGKVYWTEATGESGGTVNSANLNGSGATQLASILAAPMGIAVDTARSKLLWTNARGRIQSANLDGSGITNVVDGLGSPGDMVLSNSISAPAATTTTTTTTADNSKYDVNNDGSVDNADASLVAAAMNTSNTRYDVNGDGTVNFLDLLLVFDNRDPGAAGAPTIVGMKLTAVQVDVLQEQIHLLIATGDRSPAAMRTLVYLQQLIATARPEQTQLLANYPNPFNPETWIPYQLATDTDVRLTIYNTHGVVIRTLELGHQSSGYYVGRDRAAYWDGRNAYGEQVASGIYFYQFETDEMSTMRKMVILK